MVEVLVVEDEVRLALALADGLSSHGFKVTVERLPGAARDDILDAVAVCRTALLIAKDQATRLGPARARDRYGLPMNIWF